MAEFTSTIDLESYDAMQSLGAEVTLLGPTIIIINAEQLHSPSEFSTPSPSSNALQTTGDSLSQHIESQLPPSIVKPEEKTKPGMSSLPEGGRRRKQELQVKVEVEDGRVGSKLKQTRKPKSPLYTYTKAEDLPSDLKEMGKGGQNITKSQKCKAYRERKKTETQNFREENAHLKTQLANYKEKVFQLESELEKCRNQLELESALRWNCLNEFLMVDIPME